MTPMISFVGTDIVTPMLSLVGTDIVTPMLSLVERYRDTHDKAW